MLYNYHHLSRFLFLWLLLSAAFSYGQKNKNSYASEKWKLKDPFEQKVFIENNEGQFNGRTGNSNDRILFSARIKGVNVYFTSNGLVYRYDQCPENTQAGEEQREEEKKDPEIITHYLHERWLNSDSGVTVNGEDEGSFYYTYARGPKHTTIAHVFKKLLYKNIYPDIDIEYAFKPDTTGIEYSVIIHPGANAGSVQLAYEDADGIAIQSNGDIEIKTTMGTFTDHAPSHNYYTEVASVVNVNYLLKENTVSFACEYDHSKTLVIDPWKVNPGFTGYNAGYDVCYDIKGNVYSYGSFMPFQEIKVDNTGAIQWIFSAIFPTTFGGVQYGDFAVDENSGTSYLSSSGYAMMIKVNTLGIQTDSMDFSSQMNEVWRMYYNRCENQIIIAGGGTAGNYQMAMLDTALTSFNPVNVLGTVGGHRDVALLTIDNANKYCYWATAEPVPFPTSWNNILIKSPIPAFLPMAFSVSDGLDFTESCCDANYVDGVGGHALGLNGIVTTPNWLYCYDGSQLIRYNKYTGATVLNKPISSLKYNWGGLDADMCDNIYMANNDTIEILDSALNKVGSILVNNQVYDLHIMPNNQLCASGNGFVAAYTISTNAATLQVTQTSTPCGSSTGSATAQIVGCGNDSSLYSYLWSTGATTQTVTGLAPGTYTVTVSSNCDFKFTDTVTIKTSASGGITLSETQKNVTCNGLNNGSASITAVGGTGSYKYNWGIAGDTLASESNLPAGTYNVIVTDSAGCNTITINISQPAPLNIKVVSDNNVGCSGGNTGSSVVSASGGSPSYTYNWLPAGGSKDSAKGLGAGTYTIMVTDSNGCTASVTDTIKADVIPVVTITGNDTICSGSNTILTANGATNYSWSTGSTGSTISVSPGSTTTYTVIGNNGECNDTARVVVIVNPAPSPVISASEDTICSGNNSVLTASGGSSYIWSTGQTTSAITVTPSGTITYTVTATNGKCSAEATKTITVFGSTSPTLKQSADSICAGDSLALTAGGGSTFLWSTGSTSSSIVVKPGSSSTYSVVIKSICSSDTLKAGVIVTAVPVPVITGNDSICPGTNTVLIASGGANYVWNTGSTNATITVNPTVVTTYTVTAFNGKCSAQKTVTVKIAPLPVVTISGTGLVCKGDSITLTATGGGTYEWNTHSTSNSITVLASKDSTYYVIVTKGCADTTYHAVNIITPNSMTVCCDTTILPGGTAILSASGEVSYVWEPNGNIGCYTCGITTGSPGTATTYTVTGTDSNGCKRVGYITVDIECRDFEVPNVFTPNGDNQNDLFVIKAIGEPSYQITIYDRWGKEMFSTSNPAEYWNGNTKEGKPAPDGVYYYIIKSSCDNNNYDKHGYVQIIR